MTFTTTNSFKELQETEDEREDDPREEDEPKAAMSDTTQKLEDRMPEKSWTRSSRTIKKGKVRFAEQKMLHRSDVPHLEGRRGGSII